MYGSMSATTTLTGVLGTGQFGTPTAIANESPEAKAARKAEEARLEYERRERLAVAHVVPAVKLSEAATIGRLLHMEQTPTTLYNIMEVIRQEGSMPLDRFASGPKWKRFGHSMCHRSVVGDHARHVASNEKPPRNPMRLQEAREFIAAVARNWLEHKAGLMP